MEPAAIERFAALIEEVGELCDADRAFGGSVNVGFEDKAREVSPLLIDLELLPVLALGLRH
ncbi:hypothetical protein ABDJ38_05320 [Aurantiacibacter sp. DGU5]|uniref:Uncharacterized protein n=1 Tax=Aurantiacibacter flavus TaxID=3145232 RepID=A0ABV0CV85_9SPHN